MATRALSRPNSQSRSETFAPGFAARGSPFTVISSFVFRLLMLCLFSCLAWFSYCYSYSCFCCSRCSWHAESGAQLETQVAFGVAVGGVDDQRGFRTGKARDVEFKLGVAESSGRGREYGGLSRAVNFGGHGGGFDGPVGVVAHGDLQHGVLARKPGCGVDQFHSQDLRSLWFGALGNGDGGSLRHRKRRRHEMESAAADFFKDSAVLVVEAELECFFPVGVEREEIEIIVGAAVQHAAAAIDGSVDEGVGDAAVLGLHVKRGVTDDDIGVVAEHHGSAWASPGNYPPGI